MTFAESVQGVVQREVTDYLARHDGDRHVVEGLQIYGGENGRHASHVAELTITPGGAACYDLSMVFTPALTADEIGRLAEDGWKAEGWTDSQTTCTMLYQPASVG